MLKDVLVLYVPKFAPVFHVGEVLVTVSVNVLAVDWFSVSVAVIVHDLIPIALALPPGVVPVKFTVLFESNADNVPNPGLDVMAYPMIGESEVATKFIENDVLIARDPKFDAVLHVGGNGLLDFPRKSAKLMMPLAGIPGALP
jgi:hypothetical protein